MCNKMSDVRLSNASPTVGERVDARQPDSVRPSVRRVLFGRPDPEDIRRITAAVIEEDVRRVRDEYNFDPVSERPLTPRNYDWQEDPDAPEFFLREPHGRSAPGDSDSQSDPQPAERRGSKKRRSGASGPCSSECQSKRSRTDEEDGDGDEDKSGGAAASQAVKAAEETAGRPESSSAEVQ